jgi:hypothetical protein
VVVSRKLLWATRMMICLQPWRIESRYADLESTLPALAGSLHMTEVLGGKGGPKEDSKFGSV